MIETRKEFLFDCFITACEGGIDYWAYFHSYHWNDKEFTGKATITDFLGDDEKKYTITPETIQKGLAVICKPDIQLRDDILKTILYANKTNNAGDIDSECADCIIQAALFGSIVYG